MATSDSPLNVPNVTLAVARQAGGPPASGFTAESGFALADNGDGTLTIMDSQSRFGIKPNAAKPVWFFDFGSGTDQPHPTLSRQQKNIEWNASCGPTTAVAKAGSTHSMTIDTVAADGGGSVILGDGVNNTGDGTLTLPVNEGRKYYRYFDVYNDFTNQELINSIQANTITSYENYKTHRWQTADAQISPYTGNVMQASYYRFDFSKNPAGGTTTMYRLNEYLTSPKWTAEEEYHAISSGDGVTDAVQYGVLNGERQWLRTGFETHSGYEPSLPENKWDHYKLGNFRWWAAPGVAPWRANILYVDDSWCRVYITDKPTWNDAETKAMEIQVPVGWASGQIDFHQRTGALGGLTGKYLWAVDNDDNKILIGEWA